MAEQPETGRQGEARRILRDAEEGAEVVGTSRLAAGRRGEPEAGDRIEVWGTRIGRTLGAVAVVVLAVWLVATYLPR